VTNFINIELHYAKTLSAYNPKNWWFYLMAKVNETQAVKFSDKCIVLNERDAGEMWKLYKRKADCVLPISLKDTIDNNTLCSLNETRHLINSHNCLFVGSRFEANVRGLTWFIKNVLPFVDLHLYIIGQGMSKSFKNTGNITVKDFVQDLKEDYVNIDFVIEPIFAGGGMKTKTAEAMMWGKALIGTDEAFIGYEIDNIHGLYRCNTAREMIEAIQDIYDDDIWNFNPCIRDLFLKKYSFENTIKTLSDFFNSL
jgi:hypothetical protein